MHGRQRPQPDAGGHDGHEGVEAELDGGGEERPDGLEDRHARGLRVPQVTVEHIAQPPPVLHVHWPIQAVLPDDRGHRRGLDPGEPVGPADERSGHRENDGYRDEQAVYRSTESSVVHPIVVSTHGLDRDGNLRIEGERPR